jgi:hypothetical protein
MRDYTILNQIYICEWNNFQIHLLIIPDRDFWKTDPIEVTGKISLI